MPFPSHSYLQSYASSSDSEEEDVGNMSPLAQKYARLRAETKAMKREARRDVERLQEMAGMRAGGEEARPEKQQSASRKQTMGGVERTVRMSAAARRERLDKERRERLREALEAARNLQSEAATPAKETRKKAQAKTAQAKAQGGQWPAERRRSDNPTSPVRPRHRATPMPAEPLHSAFPSRPAMSGLKPEWCNGKGSERHKKSAPHKPTSEREKLFRQFLPESPRAKEPEQEQAAKTPRTPMETEADSPPERSTPRFETRHEKAERERAGRLRNNRRALGLDGDEPAQPKRQQPRQRAQQARPQQPPSQPQQEGTPPRNEPRRRSGVFSDLDAELDKFANRAKAEALSRQVDDQMVEEYELGWIVLEEGGARGLLEEGEVPWLPVLNLKGPAGARDSWRVVGAREHDSYDEKKAALRKQTMRWHPDRFMSKFKLREDQRESVRERVNEATHRLNELRTRLEKEGRRGGEGDT